MKKMRVLTALTLCTFLIIGGVAACKHGHHPGGFDEFDLAAATNRIAARLDLTASQKADLDQIVNEIVQKAREMHADHASRHQEMADLIRQETINKDVVEGLIDEKIERMRALADFAAERLIAFHATLTPEQREKIAEHIEDHASGDCRFGLR